MGLRDGWCRSRTRSADADLRLARAYLTTSVYHPRAADRSRTDEPAVYETAALPTELQQHKLSARLELATAPLPRGCAATCAMTAETGSGGTRTLNRMGKNQLLCQLSYEPGVNARSHALVQLAADNSRSAAKRLRARWLFLAGVSLILPAETPISFTATTYVLRSQSATMMNKSA